MTEGLVALPEPDGQHLVGPFLIRHLPLELGHAGLLLLEGLLHSYLRRPQGGGLGVPCSRGLHLLLQLLLDRFELLAEPIALFGYGGEGLPALLQRGLVFAGLIFDGVSLGAQPAVLGLETLHLATGVGDLRLQLLDARRAGLELFFQPLAFLRCGGVGLCALVQLLVLPLQTLQPRAQALPGALRLGEPLFAGHELLAELIPLALGFLQTVGLQRL